MTRTNLFCSILATFALVAGAPARAQGGFARTGDATIGRNLCEATLLADGRVLVTGGTRDGSSGALYNNEAEIYDPATATFTATGSMSTPRAHHAAVRLKDGRVLILGGAREDGVLGLNSAEIYDPVTGAFKPTGSMSYRRDSATATLLRDGRVLVVGGVYTEGTQGKVVVQSEIYDPATGTFSAGAHVRIPRSAHSAVALPDGRVLIVGGLHHPSGSTAAAMGEVEVFDPVRGAFSWIGQLNEGRFYPSVTLLGDGRVVVVGGLGVAADQQASVSKTLEVFDLASGTSSLLTSMSVARNRPVAVTLTDGRVLVAGGITSRTGIITTTADLFDPTSGTVTPTSRMTTPRSGPGSALLQDGSVLIVGGANYKEDGSLTRLRSAEIYTR